MGDCVPVCMEVDTDIPSRSDIHHPAYLIHICQ